MTEENSTTPKRRPGRPPLPDDQRKTGSNVTFRARAGLREQLTSAAEASGRSVSEEVEHRLSQSFVWEDAFGDAKNLLARYRGFAADELKKALKQEGYTRIRTGGRVFWQEPGSEESSTTLVSDFKEVKHASDFNDIKRAVAEALAEAGLTERKPG